MTTVIRINLLYLQTALIIAGPGVTLYRMRASNTPPPSYFCSRPIFARAKRRNPRSSLFLRSLLHGNACYAGYPVRFGAIKVVAPSVLLLKMAVINILFIVLDKRLKSNHILLVKPLMLFT